MFSLEALDANNGDCLFLHFGEPDDPQLIVVDGGPRFSGSSTFDSAVAPRLEEIARLRGIALPLDVELLMVSHVDDDHIGGVQFLLKRANGSRNPLVNLRGLWHNAFDDFLTTDQIAAIAGFGNTRSAAFDSHTVGLAAGVKQGLAVRDKAAQMGLAVNAGTANGFVAAGDEFNLGSTKLRVLGPAKSELLALQEKFDEENPNVAGMTAGERRAAIAAFTDRSIANLASIVVLVERNGKTILLTGDARGDKILEGLEAAGFRHGRIHVDILKIPHHGSDRNVSTDFFRKVTADHYVFSGDGKHHNPEEATLAMLTTAREDAEYTMWFTHELDYLVSFIQADTRRNARDYSYAFRNDDATSLWIDLEEELTF